MNAPDDYNPLVHDDYDAEAEPFEMPDDGFLYGDPPEDLPPSVQPALQQGLLLGPELLLGPYQRGSGRHPTIRLYDADGNEWVWQEIHRPIEEIFSGATWTVTFGIASVIGGDSDAAR